MNYTSFRSGHYLLTTCGGVRLIPRISVLLVQHLPALFTARPAHMGFLLRPTKGSSCKSHSGRHQSAVYPCHNADSQSTVEQAGVQDVFRLLRRNQYSLHSFSYGWIHYSVAVLRGCTHGNIFISVTYPYPYQFEHNITNLGPYLSKA